MSEGLLEVLCEGDTDHALMSGMLAAGLLPERIEIKKPRKGRGGKDVLPLDAAALLAAGRRVVVVRDRDDQSPGTIAAQLCEVTRRLVPDLGEPAGVQERPGAYVVAIADAPRLDVVIVGLDDLEGLTGVAGLTRRAIDDYVLRLALDQMTWEHRSELRVCPHTVFRAKIREVADLLARNGIPPTSSKQLAQTIRLVTPFGASPAQAAQDLWNAAVAVHGAAVAPFAEPFASALRATVTALRTPPPPESLGGSRPALV